EIRSALQRLHHEKAQLSGQVSTGDGDVKAAPIKLKEVAENIEILEARLRNLESAPNATLK
ncbi:hypothetical protein ABTN55_20490, partial [Acinetobacter baumannii]